MSTFVWQKKWRIYFCLCSKFRLWFSIKFNWLFFIFSFCFFFFFIYQKMNFSTQLWGDSLHRLSIESFLQYFMTDTFKISNCAFKVCCRAMKIISNLYFVWSEFIFFSVMQILFFLCWSLDGLADFGKLLWLNEIHFTLSSFSVESTLKLECVERFSWSISGIEPLNRPYEGRNFLSISRHSSWETRQFR